MNNPGRKGSGIGVPKRPKMPVMPVCYGGRTIASRLGRSPRRPASEPYPRGTNFEPENPAMLAIILVVGLANLVLGYTAAMLLGYGPPLPLALGIGAPWNAALGPSDRATPSAAASQTVAFDRLILAFRKRSRGITQAATIENRLRELPANPDSAAVQQSVEELLIDCQNYLAEQRAAWESPAQPAVPLAENIEAARLRQAARVESLLAALEKPSADEPAQTVPWLLQQVHSLIAGWHQLRDDLQALFLPALRQTGSLESVGEPLTSDAFCGLPNRIGLEIAFETWQRTNVPGRAIVVRSGRCWIWTASMPSMRGVLARS